MVKYLAITNPVGSISLRVKSGVCAIGQHGEVGDAPTESSITVMQLHMAGISEPVEVLDGAACVVTDYYRVA